MALIACPDCGNQVSKLAPACPKCGRPIKPQKTGGSSRRVTGGGAGIKFLGMMSMIAGIIYPAFAQTPDSMAWGVGLFFGGFFVFVFGRFFDAG